MVGKEHEYRAMADCERKLWWYRSLHRLTLQKMKKYGASGDSVILDAGCGTGGMLGVLKENGFRNIKGFDLSPDAIYYSKSNFQFDVRLLNILDCDTSYPSQSFDIIISNDVLCLLAGDQDKVALKKLISLLKPGGHLLMNLPAGNAFRGTHDVAVGISKRYSLQSLPQFNLKTVTLKETLYWPFLLSPVIFGVRSFQRMKMLFKKSKEVISDVSMPPPFINKILGTITGWENEILHKKPWGSSIFLVLQKCP